LIKILKENLGYVKAKAVLVPLLKKIPYLFLVVNFVLLPEHLLILFFDFLFQLIYSLAEGDWVALHFVERKAVKINFQVCAFIFDLLFELEVEVKKFIEHN
jgi:hypothetical protein